MDRGVPGWPQRGVRGLTGIYRNAEARGRGDGSIRGGPWTLLELEPRTKSAAIGDEPSSEVELLKVKEGTPWLEYFDRFEEINTRLLSRCRQENLQQLPPIQ